MSHSTHVGFSTPPFPAPICLASSMVVLRFRASQLPVPPHIPFVLGVGQNPEALSAVVCPHIVSSQNSPPDMIPHCGKVGENCSGEIGVPKKSWHILTVKGSGSYSANNLCGFRPHVSGVVFGLLLSRHAEWLAWEACCNQVRKSSVLLGCTRLYELTHVCIDWGIRQYSVFNSLGEHPLAVWVDFDIPDWSVPEKHCSEDTAPCAGKK